MGFIIEIPNKMVLQALRSTTSRGVQATRINHVTKRHMGAAPKKDWEGIDKVVRDVLPKDSQVAAAILGGYGGLIGIAMIRSKMKGSPKEEAAPAAAASSSAPSSDILPSVESPDFEKFLESDAFGKFVESEDSMMKWVDSLAAE